MDLFDFLAEKVQDNSLTKVVSFLYSQIDIQRKIPATMKYIARNNTELRDEIVNELLKHRPNFEIYKVMDELNFTEDGILPLLTVKHHLRKVYPYLEEAKASLFVALVDINND